MQNSIQMQRRNGLLKQEWISSQPMMNVQRNGDIELADCKLSGVNAEMIHGNKGRERERVRERKRFGMEEGVTVAGGCHDCGGRNVWEGGMCGR